MTSRIASRLDRLETAIRRQRGGVYLVAKVGDLYRLANGELITRAELDRLAEDNDGIHPILILDGPWVSVRTPQ